MAVDREPTVHLSHARLPEQLEVMTGIIADGVCPFCIDSLAKYHKPPILYRGEHWLLTPNQWPYDYTRLHLLAITAYHAVRLADLRPGALDELQGVLQTAESEYDIQAGGIAMRFGDMSRTGATVSHMHAHLIVPDPDKPPDAKVRFKIS